MEVALYEYLDEHGGERDRGYQRYEKRVGKRELGAKVGTMGKRVAEVVEL